MSSTEPVTTTQRRRVPVTERTKTRGAAAIEFALILPLLVLLVFGIVEFGRAYNAKVTLTHAAREAVREYTVTGNLVNGQNAGVDAALNLSGVVVSITPCTGVAGERSTAEASWDFTYEIPLFGGGTTNLKESAVMRCGG